MADLIKKLDEQGLKTLISLIKGDNKEIGPEFVRGTPNTNIVHGTDNRLYINDETSGNNNIVSGKNNTVLGVSNLVTGENNSSYNASGRSIIGGLGNTNYGQNNILLGYGNSAQGNNQIVLGTNNIANSNTAIQGNDFTITNKGEFKGTKYFVKNTEAVLPPLDDNKILYQNILNNSNKTRSFNHNLESTLNFNNSVVIACGSNRIDGIDYNAIVVTGSIFPEIKEEKTYWIIINNSDVLKIEKIEPHTTYGKNYKLYYKPTSNIYLNIDIINFKNKVNSIRFIAEEYLWQTDIKASEILEQANAYTDNKAIETLEQAASYDEVVQQNANQYAENIALVSNEVIRTNEVTLYDDYGSIRKAKTLTVDIENESTDDVVFRFSDAEELTVPSDTKKLYFDFVNKKAYKKSSADTSLQRYEAADGFASYYAEYQGYSLYMELYTPKTANVILKYAYMATSDYGVHAAKNYTDKKCKNLSNAVLGEKNGGVVRVSDVLPYNQNISVRISSDSVTDLSPVKLLKYGTNMFNCYGISTYNINSPGAECKLTNNYGTTIDKISLSLEDDSITVTQSQYPDTTKKYNYTNGYFCLGLSHLIAGQTYTLSFNFSPTNDPFSMMSAFTDSSIYVIVNGATPRAFWKKVSDTRYSISFIYEVREDKPLARYIEFRMYGMSGVFSDFQLEVGNTASNYVPQSVPVSYNVSTDGSVQGVTANDGVTTLVSDTDGVIISASYNKDINAVIKELQNAIIALGGSF